MKYHLLKLIKQQTNRWRNQQYDTQETIKNVPEKETPHVGLEQVADAEALANGGDFNHIGLRQFFLSVLRRNQDAGTQG